MPRNVPLGLKNLLATGHCIEHSILVIEKDDDTFRWSTIDAVIDGDEFDARIKSRGPLKQSLGRAIDNVEVTLENVQSNFGGEFVGLTNKLDRATARVGRIFIHPTTGESWLRIEMQGIVASVQFTQDEFRLTVIHDAAGRGQLASRGTGRTCQFKYKDPDTCGATSSEPNCSKIRDDVAGCTGRSNEHGYGGFSKADNADTVNAPTSAPVNTQPQGWTQDAYRVATDYRI